MDEIQNKYVLNKFKERSNKQKQIRFEIIDLEIYCASACCAAFMMTKDLILNRVRAFLFNYHETLMDYDNYLVEWNDRPSKNGSTFQEIEIKIYKVDPPRKVAPPPICLKMPQMPTIIAPIPDADKALLEHVKEVHGTLPKQNQNQRSYARPLLMRKRIINLTD